MNLSNVFYFKNIVDGYYPDEKPKVKIKSIVAKVKNEIRNLSDSDFIEVMTSFLFLIYTLVWVSGKSSLPN